MCVIKEEVLPKYKGQEREESEQGGKVLRGMKWQAMRRTGTAGQALVAFEKLGGISPGKSGA